MDLSSVPIYQPCSQKKGSIFSKFLISSFEGLLIYLNLNPLTYNLLFYINFKCPEIDL